MAIITIKTRTGELPHNLDVYYHWQGPEDGLPVVWLAGLGQDHLAWGLQMAAFSKRFRCLLVDNRDVGRSGTVEMDYTSQDMANDLVGLLDALDIPTISVVGLSLGGLIAQEFALAYPKRLQKLVLLSTQPGGDPWLDAIVETWALLYATLSPAEFVKAVSPWLYTWRIYQQRPAFLQVLAQRRADNPRPQSVAAYQRQTQVSVSHNTLERLSLIQAPTLILVGAEDILTPPRYSQAMLERIPAARLEIIPNSGHGGSVETPTAFNQPLLDFLTASKLS